MRESQVFSQGSSYSLLIYFGRGCVLKVGRLGNIDFPRGYYVYTGSARTNMKARVNRHLAKEKPLRWHIDYLLVSPWAEVKKTCIHPHGVEECQANQRVMSLEGSRLVAKGFGSSDCKNHCPSHLFYFPCWEENKGGNLFLWKKSKIQSSNVKLNPKSK